jgi:hypothetical protein
MEVIYTGRRACHHTSDMTSEDTIRSSVPISLVAIPIAMLAYLIQTIPIIGVFLMMMMAATWPGVLLLAALGGTAAEAILGRVSHWWLLFPLTVLGVYEGFALADHMRAWRMDDDLALVEKTSAKGRSIVIIGDQSSDIAQKLVQTHEMGAVHQAVVENEVTTRYISHQLIPKADCQTDRSRLSGQMITTTSFHHAHGSEVHSALDAGACVLTMNDVPTYPPIFIEVVEKREIIASLPVVTRTAIVDMEGTRRATIIERFSRPLSWTPLILAGCGLNSGNPSWDCVVRPMRNTVGDPSGTGMVERIASMLDLPARQPGDVPDVDAESIIRSAASRVSAHRERTDSRYRSLLEGLLADPAADVTRQDFERLARLPGVVGPKLLDLEEQLGRMKDRRMVFERIPTACGSTDQSPVCRSRRMMANTDGLHALLQWRIDASTLDDDDRRTLNSIRGRIADRINQNERAAREGRMDHISELRRQDAMARRHGR